LIIIENRGNSFLKKKKKAKIKDKKAGKPKQIKIVKNPEALSSAAVWLQFLSLYKEY